TRARAADAALGDVRRFPAELRRRSVRDDDLVVEPDAQRGILRQDVHAQQCSPVGLPSDFPVLADIRARHRDAVDRDRDRHYNEALSAPVKPGRMAKPTRLPSRKTPCWPCAPPRAVDVPAKRLPSPLKAKSSWPPE